MRRTSNAKFSLRIFLLAILCISAGQLHLDAFAQNVTKPSDIIATGTLIINSNGLKFAYCPAGAFKMGYGGWGPIHTVTIGEGFWMGTTEVTQGQWMSVTATKPGNFNGDNLPVENVSWEDAGKFISRMNAKNDGHEYRLPTESEWEYAARAGTTGLRYGNLNDIAWYIDNSNETTHPVGKKQPNAFGLYDMLGNVSEWTEDIWSETYGGLPSNGSANISLGDSKMRVIRGGSWDYYDHYSRSADRNGVPISMTNNNLGFRVVARSK